MVEIADDAGQSRARGVAALIGNLPRLVAALVVVAACASCQPSPAVTTTNGAPTDTATASGATRGFELVRHRPPLLRAFLQRMPKGGDLHTHLVGAIYAESYIAWAAADGLCVDPATLGFVAPPCTAPRRKASDALTDQAFYDSIIDAMSVRNFVPGKKSGHDQFFDTFAKFGPVTGNHRGDMLAEVAARAAAQHVTYLEIMETLQGKPLGELVAKLPAKDLGPAFADVESGALPTSDELTRLRKALLDQGLARLVEAAHRDLDAAEASKNQRLGCDTSSPDPGCGVTIRYLYQTIRTAPPLSVYAQLVLAFELVKGEKRVVGLNMVAPEDYRVARRDYKRHMAMLDFLWHEAPEVGISLHAGELTLGLVPPDELRNHIRLAVEQGHAKRLGHAVAIGYEDDAFGLLKELAQRQVDVEINLTSNDQILNVVGAAHPFPDYRRAGVPVTISTDDEGVSRSDLTHEYQRAVETYDLGYEDLKTIVRTSIAVSFLAGPSLWQSTRPFTPVADCAADALGSAMPSQACQRFLAASDRARESWRLESELASFERLDWRLDER
jgi:Adenosine deaminase